jgi:sulfopyruvate decarboxylase TPP-binding subunit
LADTTIPEHPQTLLESIAADVPLARALEDFLTASKLTLAPDRAERRAASAGNVVSMRCPNRYSRRWPSSSSI